MPLLNITNALAAFQTFLIEAKFWEQPEKHVKTPADYAVINHNDGGMTFKFLTHEVKFDREGKHVHTKSTAFIVELVEKDDGIPKEERRKIKVTVNGDSHFLYINPEGYGEAGAIHGDGSPVFLELYDNELRCVVSPDINDEDKTIISLENAREDKDQHPNG